MRQTIVVVSSMQTNDRAIETEFYLGEYRNKNHSAFVYLFPLHLARALLTGTLFSNVFASLSCALGALIKTFLTPSHVNYAPCKFLCYEWSKDNTASKASEKARYVVMIVVSGNGFNVIIKRGFFNSMLGSSLLVGCVS